MILYVNLQGIKFFLAFFRNNLTDTQLIYHTIHCELNCSEHFLSMESGDTWPPVATFFHLCQAYSTCFPFVAKYYSKMGKQHFVFLLVNGFLDYFHFLAIVSNAAIAILMQGFV